MNDDRWRSNNGELRMVSSSAAPADPGASPGRRGAVQPRQADSRFTDTLCRRAAYQNSLSIEKRKLVDEIAMVFEELSELEMDAGLLDAFRQGAAAISGDRLPLIAAIPDPYVCRTCGHIALGEVTENCPTCGAWTDTFQRFAPIYWLDALDPPAALTWRCAQQALRRPKSIQDLGTLCSGCSSPKAINENGQHRCAEHNSRYSLHQIKKLQDLSSDRWGIRIFPQ